MSLKNQQGNNIYTEQSVGDENLDVQGVGSPKQSPADFSVENNMQKNQGWIKVHRTLIDKGYFKHSAYVHLWVYLLMLANHQSNEFMWNGKVQRLKPGQFITGRHILSRDTGIPETTIERILETFVREGQIGQQKTTKYRLITILNWNKWQNSDSKWTTNGQQTDTNKNDKNDKKNTTDPKVSEEINSIITLFKGVNLTYDQLYKNTNERAAVKYLVDKFGYDKIYRTVEHLPEIINKPYAPKITTPIQLKRDLGKLIAFNNQEKNKKISKTTPNFIL